MDRLHKAEGEEVNRRNFLKLTIGGAAVVMANRAIPQFAQQFIAKDEAGLWMHWITSKGGVLFRRPARLDGDCVRAEFETKVTGELAHVEVWKDGQHILTANESGFKPNTQVWSIGVALT